jgi:Berberine and berberine like
LACHSGDPDQAAADLEPITSIGEPLANLIQPKEYVAQQSMLDATQPKGMHYYWKSEYVPGLSDGLIAAYQRQFEGLSAPANQIVLFQMDGALNERAADDGAVGNRDASFACVIQSMWAPDSPAGDSNRAWVRNAWEAVRPFSTGGNYINFQTQDEPEDRTLEAFGANYARLKAVKARYDPTNLFRVNRNIRS